jgi:integrase/recombinase XerD
MGDSSQLAAPLLALPQDGHRVERFDPKTVTPFVQRSVSEETRRAYRRVVLEFFRFLQSCHPAEVTPTDVQRWRDHLLKAKKSAATVRFKLSVVRSLFDFLKAGGYVSANPALTRLVSPPAATEDLRGRALSRKEVSCLLAGPDRAKPEGARDYALLLLMLRTSLRVSEACSLKASSMKWSHGRWVLRCKVKGGRERTLPLPQEVKQAIDDYLKIDRARRAKLLCDGADSYLFQPVINNRTLIFDKGLSTTMAWYIVRRWGEYGGIGKLSPHDLRRTAITRALDQGLSYRQVQMMSGHKDPKTVMRYDHHRENLEQNAVNFLSYSEDDSSSEDGKAGQ